MWTYHSKKINFVDTWLNEPNFANGQMEKISNTMIVQDITNTTLIYFQLHQHYFKKDVGFKNIRDLLSYIISPRFVQRKA